MNCACLRLLLGVALVALSLSQISADYAYGLTDGERILNELCEYNKKYDPNYDCTIIRPSYSSSQPKSSQSFSEQSTNPLENPSSVGSNTKEISSEDAGDGILTIILGAVFLIIAPIIFVQVWKNHSSARSIYSNSRDQYRKGYKESMGSSRERENNKEEQRRYEKFKQEQSRQRQEQQRREQERSRQEESQQEQSRQRQEQSQNDNSNSEQITIHDACAILEVDEKSTSDEIKQSRKRLSLQWHPDKHRTPARKQIAEKEMKLINEAFEILKRELKFG